MMRPLPKYTGFDLAKPGSDETVVHISGGRGSGKTAALEREIEKHLDAGYTVYDARTGELRGATQARDITPTFVETDK